MLLLQEVMTEESSWGRGRVPYQVDRAVVVVFKVATVVIRAFVAVAVVAAGAVSGAAVSVVERLLLVAYRRRRRSTMNKFCSKIILNLRV